MDNGRLPWAAYRVLILGRLVGLDKCQGAEPVTVGETWQKILAKCVLDVTGADSKET